eukprot:s462_g66.t1
MEAIAEPGYKVAITTLAIIQLDHLIQGLGLHERCHHLSGDLICEAWHDTHAISQAAPLQGHNGVSIVARLRPRPQLVPEDAAPGLGLLQHRVQLHRSAPTLTTPPVFPLERQTADTVAHGQWPKGTPAQYPAKRPLRLSSRLQSDESFMPTDQSFLSLNLTEAWKCFETYDASFFLPSFCLDAHLQSDWTETWWDCQAVVTHVWIYHDGSHKDAGAGAATAAFLFQPDLGWVFGGALSATFPATVTSYGAELRSGILAAQSLIDILKIVSYNQNFMPQVCLLRDNVSVGAQLTGQWHANADVRAAAFLRHIVVYCEHRYGVTVATQHVTAHQGDVGNELVDVLAGLAADSKPLVDLAAWFETVLSPRFGQAAAWFWVFHSHQFVKWWDGPCLRLPSVASTCPTADVLPVDPEVPAAHNTGALDMIVGTCNVLTLRSSATTTAPDALTGISGPTRQQSVFRQFHEAEVCIMVLQEIRLQRVGHSIEDYMIFAGAATGQGHFGILAALSTTLPYGTRGRTQKLFFKRSHVAVISLSSRWVILRVATPWIKFVLIGAHAPHSGQPLSVIEAWWAELEQQLPASLNDWPRLLLADANAKIAQRGPWTKPAIIKNGATSADLSSSRSAPQPGCEVDVHSHAALLQQQILDCLPTSPPLGPAKLKYTMSASTWDLVQQKRQWRATLHEAQALQRQLLRQVFFLLWRATRSGEFDVDFLPQMDQLLCEHDRLIARALHEFRSLGRLVAAASRADDRAYFGQVLREGADFLQPHQSRELWREGPLPSPPCWTEIPSLFDLEQVLRSNKTGRATGHDPVSSALWHNHPAILAEHSSALMIKMWVWSEEPVQYKGGPLALLPKRSQPTEAQHFRGILLLPTLAKAFHALLRKKIIALLHPVRSQGQLGGFHQQEVLFGSHALRMLGRLAIARHYSIGVLFVDLSTAFHCLIRGMVVGVSSTARLEFVLASLRRQGHPCDQLRLGQELPGLLTELGASSSLVRLLQNIHSHTWMTIGSNNYIRTHKGTRPGSPLADAIFHFIMHDVSLSLRTFLQDEGHIDFLRDTFDVDLEPIIWSDDLAVPIVTEHCTALIPALMKLLDQVRSFSLQRGFVLNFAKGKTGVVATSCGPAAPDLRRDVQLTAQPGVHHQFPDGSSTFVHFSPAYRHLGTLFTSDQKLDAEVSARIGAAASAFSQISRRVLLNRNLPCHLRLQLFGSLILSKLYFGIGSWHTPTGRQLDRLRTCVARMVRKILKLPPGPMEFRLPKS